MRVVVTGMAVWCSVARTLDDFGAALQRDAPDGGP